MSSWFHMDLPEGWAHDTWDMESARIAGGVPLRMVGVFPTNDKSGNAVCLLYSDGSLHVSGKNNYNWDTFPSLDAAKKYIITMCALNTWEAP